MATGGGIVADVAGNQAGDIVVQGLPLGLEASCVKHVGAGPQCASPPELLRAESVVKNLRATDGKVANTSLQQMLGVDGVWTDSIDQRRSPMARND